jgi:hypothetical protein
VFDTDRLRAFRRDERGIEGLPVRLVIALVVGVASLSIMLNLLSGVQGLTTTELDVRPEPEVVGPEPTDVEVTVVGTDGAPVAGATVLVKGDSAGLDGVVRATTGEDGTATLSVSPTLRANQQEGTLVLDVKPPAGSGYRDRRRNTRILVVRA